MVFNHKKSTCNAGDLGLILGLWRSPRERNIYPLNYFGLENIMESGAWQVIAHGITKNRTWLSDFPFHFLSFPFIALSDSSGTHVPIYIYILFLFTSTQLGVCLPCGFFIACYSASSTGTSIHSAVMFSMLCNWDPKQWSLLNCINGLAMTVFRSDMNVKVYDF